MKKLLFGLLICGIVPVIASSCKKEKKLDCNSAAKKVVDAAQAYGTTGNCAAYKAAIQEYLETDCFTGLSDQEKAAYQLSLSALECEN